MADLVVEVDDAGRQSDITRDIGPRVGQVYDGLGEREQALVYYRQALDDRTELPVKPS